jgi:TonB-dependent receptor
MHAIPTARRAHRVALLGATMLAGFATPALAQDAAPVAAPPPAAAAVPADQSEIVVTGYRRSLAESTQAKRAATSFTDSIFSEDIGKFPDVNIAESFNRVPGITISRDINGEGTTVAIRGLGANFTNVTLNGAPIAVASTGGADPQGTDRSVDLSFFPTDLFSKLTVNKSYRADLLEGGAAGNIDIRNVRPFDTPGTHVTYNAQATKQSLASKWGGRGSIIASTTSDTLGVLVGVSGNRTQSRVTGFESIGWTNPNLSAAQCGAASGCNSTGGGNWTIPATVPAGAGNGLTTGATIDQAFLLAHNPGATIQQIDNGIIPRLGRTLDDYGTRDRLNGVISAEWRPSDNLHVYVDGLYGTKVNKLQRIDMDWVGRNGAAIPINTTYDKTDCSAGCTVTGGTYANSQFFLEYRPYTEHTKFWSANPGVEWKIGSKLTAHLQGNYTRSTYHRESPSVLAVTAPNSGLTVTYKNEGAIPSILSSVDLDNPANFGWVGGRVNIQDEKRVNLTKGIRGDLAWGDDKLNIKVGGNYDDISRRIRGFDNSQAWQNAVCGDNPSVFLPGPNSQPPCQGLSTPTPGAGYPTYPGYGTGFTTGQTGPITYGGSLVTVAQLQQFLVPGPDGFVTLNWPGFAQASNYKQFHDSAPQSGGTNTGAAGGYIREQSPAAFAEVSGIQQIAGSDLRFNVGVRWVHTKQTIKGLVSLTDPRNTPAAPAVAPADGGKYPNVSTEVTTSQSYTKWLPAANFALDLGEHAVARFAVSETMTRPDPAAQLPGVSFSSPSADIGSIGNPALKPYTSKNIDLGIEYYTGHEGLISVAAFRKELKGFTVNGTTTLPFSALAQYGITYGSLSPTQQVAIDSRGGPNSATVQMTQQVNASGKLDVNGMEFQWVQPLDFILDPLVGVRGLGFNANATIVDQKGSGAAPATALGVAKYTYNITGYYEHGGISLRLTQTFQKGAQVTNPGQNGISAAAFYTKDYHQLDFGSTFDLEKLFGVRHAPQITFDVVNITNESLGNYFQFPNATQQLDRPGRQFMIGLRGSF